MVRARSTIRKAVTTAALLLLVLPALALDFPALTGRVVDDANILNATTRASLEQKLADLETKTTNQLVVVTLKSLQGTTIEDFGVQLGRRWQIGQRGKNNGVLLIVAPTERKVRIEVGYGLEGSLTDAVSRLIIENSILPRFRANDYPGGISRGADDIIQVLSGDAEEFKQRAAQRPDAAPRSIDFGMLLALLIVIWIVATLVRQSARQSAHARRRGSIWGTGWGGGWGGGDWSGGSSWSSGSGGGFSGGGGSFGGGGSSGSW
jgi:uncharacterized protein